MRLYTAYRLIAQDLIEHLQPVLLHDSDYTDRTKLYLETDAMRHTSHYLKLVASKIKCSIDLNAIADYLDYLIRLYDLVLYDTNTPTYEEFKNLIDTVKAFSNQVLDLIVFGDLDYV